MTVSSSTPGCAKEREENVYGRGTLLQSQCSSPIERGGKGGEDETLNKANEHLSREKLVTGTKELL